MKLDIREVEPGVFSVLVDGASYEVRIDGDTVSIAGRRYGLENRDPRKWNPAAGGVEAHARDTIKAPMPGKIVRVLVAQGDEVRSGQGVVVVEAMKMQNELKTHRAGKVTRVGVSEHDTVEAGAVLVVVE